MSILLQMVSLCGKVIRKLNRATFSKVCTLIDKHHGNSILIKQQLAKSQSSSVTPTQLQRRIDQSKPSRDRSKQSNAKQIERDFFLSVLSTSATKRDAKAYLSRFNDPETKHLDLNARSVRDQHKSVTHIALTKFHLPEDAPSDLLEGIGRTFSQLAKLGLSSVIVIDNDKASSHENQEDLHIWYKNITEDADRLSSALYRYPSIVPQKLDVLGIQPMDRRCSTKPEIFVQYLELLIRQIRRGMIPIICPIAYTADSQKMVKIDPDDVMLSLTRAFRGLDFGTNLREQHQNVRSSTNVEDGKKGILSLDRIILLDPFGGIPSGDGANKNHIFINMEQEYDDIRQKLITSQWSKDVSEEFKRRHVKNLDLLHRSLALLPSSSSALVMTPDDAATPASGTTLVEEEPSVGTRRPKNPLLYNFLTDRPLISSSLPPARLDSSEGMRDSFVSKSAGSTFVKRGMPLTLIPNPTIQIWQPPKAGETNLSFHDSRIDFSRLLNLIEDSFGRPLDVDHYLDRVHNKIAGVIVAGEYEGGAILTWEIPPGVFDDGSEASRQRMVPYLDKFAVLKRSQGAGGVADIVFTAMVKDCFPKGVCWRSRKNNPVNKWYFERAAGTWKLPGADWTMFWTTRDLPAYSSRWLDYEAVCRHVQPSWADNKQVVD